MRERNERKKKKFYIPYIFSSPALTYMIISSLLSLCFHFSFYVLKWKYKTKTKMNIQSWSLCWVTNCSCKIPVHRVGVAFHNLGQFYIAQRKLEEARTCYEVGSFIFSPCFVVMTIGSTTVPMWSLLSFYFKFVFYGILSLYFHFYKVH